MTAGAGAGRAPRQRHIPKMAQVVATELRERILGGEFAEGESLSTESALVEEYGISRPTLREALRLLEAQQLIVVRRGSHRGSVVSRPDPGPTAESFSLLLQLRRATLADVYEFRSVFEPPAVRMAAERATGRDVERLRELLEREWEVRTDPDEFPRVAWRFHTELIRISGNVTMTVTAEMLEMISAQHARRAQVSWWDGDSQRRRAYRAHCRVVELIAGRDGPEAERYWSEHMAEVGKKLGQTAESSIIEIMDRS